jgi:hypothetical protein
LEFSTAKDAKENGFTAENAEIAEKKWVPNSDQQGYLFRCALSELCGNFLPFALFVSLAVKFGSSIWLIADC